MRKLYHCIECGKSFASRQSRWNHKQRCVGKAQNTSSAITPKGDANPVTAKANISKTVVASTIDRIINGNNSPGSDMKYLSPLHIETSNKVSDLSAGSSGEESVDESETEQTFNEPDVDSEEIGKSDEDESDESGTSESDTEAPLDDAAIKNLMKRFKILHYQLIHEGRKDHVPVLLEIITILNDEGQLGDEIDRIVKSVTKYQ